MSSNNTYFNILCSFAYLGKNVKFADNFFGLHKSGEANCMLDSGAYSALNAQKKMPWVNISSYCDFLQTYKEYCEKYVQLDVIGNIEKTRENYKIMIERGLRPMYVLTMYDNDWEYLNQIVREYNSDICVAGGTMTKGPWLIKRFQDANLHTDKKCKIHALGYVTYPGIIKAPIVSGDSSSLFLSSQKFGNISAWTRDGLSTQNYKDIWAGQKIKPEIISLLDEIHVTPRMFMQRKYQVGGRNISVLANILSYIRYQKYVYGFGKRLFIALANPAQLSYVTWVNRNIGKCYYEEFINEFGI